MCLVRLPLLDIYEVLGGFFYSISNNGQNRRRSRTIVIVAGVKNATLSNETLHAINN